MSYKKLASVSPIVMLISSLVATGCTAAHSNLENKSSNVNRNSSSCSVDIKTGNGQSQSFSVSSSSHNNFDSGVEGSGHVISEPRTIGAFKQIEFATSMDADIVVGKEPSLVLTGDDNILPLIKTSENNGLLKIECDKSFRSQKIKAVLTTPSLTGLCLSGSGNVKASDVKSDNFDMELTGSGNIDMSGNAKQMTAVLQGSGNAKLESFKVQQATAVVSGSGDMTVNATNKLDANITGSGNIRYVGNPASIKQSILGSGTIKQI